MTADLTPFAYGDIELRSVVIDGEAWFVAADATALLGYGGGARNAITKLPDRMKGVAEINTLGGVQRMTTVNEAGVNRLIMRSTLADAEQVQDWLAEDVLPAIRKTGSYSAPESREQLIARALIESQSVIAEKDQRIAELEPSARAWNELADASGDYDTRAAAQIIARGGVDMGQNRLRAYLRQIEWTDRNNRPYQRHVQAGRLAEKVRRWEDRESGEIHIDHQLRVTAKGVGELLNKLTAGGHLQVVS